MNELDLLRQWEPAPAEFDAAAEPSARAALDDTMTARVPVAPPPSRRVGRRVAGRAVAATLAAAAVLIAGVIVLERRVDDRLGQVKRVHVRAGVLQPAAVGSPQTFLIVGTDSRAFVQDATEVQTFGTSQDVGGARSDTMILVRVRPGGTDAVWLPRDLLVSVEGQPPRQLNSYLNGGAGALISAIDAVFGVRVDHYVEINFPGFIRAVDAAGGVRLDVPVPVRDRYSGLNLAGAGCTALDGDTALAWVRSRHLETFMDRHWTDASGRADLDRLARQQQFLRAVVSQLRRRLGGDLASADRVSAAMVRAMAVDSRLSVDQLRDLTDRFLTDDPASWTFATLPTVPSAQESGRLEAAPHDPALGVFAWARDSAYADQGGGSSAGGPSPAAGLGTPC